MSVYLHGSQGLSPDNRYLISEVLRYVGMLNVLGMDWMVLGDWNLEPTEWEDQWIRQVRGQLHVPTGPICWKSAMGTVYDYALVTANLQSRLQQPEVDHGTNVRTHTPVRVPLPVRDTPTWKRVLQGPLGFGATPPIGCSYCPPKRAWQEVQA
eukprot:7437115-Pyramimonas_sp.AAC.1